MKNYNTIIIFIFIFILTLISLYILLYIDTNIINNNNNNDLSMTRTITAKPEIKNINTGEIIQESQIIENNKIYNKTVSIDENIVIYHNGIKFG